MVLSHPVVSTTPSKKYPRNDLDQAEIGQVAVKSGSGPLARLLDGMSGKFKRQSSSIADARFYPIDKGGMNAVAGDQIAAALRNADHRPAGLQLRSSDAVIAVALQVHGFFTRFIAVVEPEIAA